MGKGLENDNPKERAGTPPNMVNNSEEGFNHIPSSIDNREDRLYDVIDWRALGVVFNMCFV